MKPTTAYLALSAAFCATTTAQSQTFFNPVLPGWHSDPSCVFVAERDNTTFCTTSTFLRTPGLPVLASRDLLNWKIASHAITRENQVSEYARAVPQSDGIWAATIRYRRGTFYIITVYRDNLSPGIEGNKGLIFTSTDPYKDSSWSDPIRFRTAEIDPDLFWDDDGTAYMLTAGISISTMDPSTGITGNTTRIWNGTDGAFLEGPHMYKKDGFYYLMIAEGGSGLNHSVTIARSKDIRGPYESNPANPVLGNAGTDEYFQNVGHADLFQDANGHWWSSVLCWRSGPEALSYPMGREMSITPVSWPEGDWPVFAPVRGEMKGWARPTAINTPGDDGLFTDDVIDFESTSLPKHFSFWRFPNQQSYAVSPEGHPGTLRLTQSFGSIMDGVDNFTAGFDLADRTLIMRQQMHTLFEYSVDVDFAPREQGEEVGITLFLNNVQNINLGIVMLPGNATTNTTTAAAASRPLVRPHLRFRASGGGSLNPADSPKTVVKPLPCTWAGHPVRLILRAQDSQTYTLYAASSLRPDPTEMKLGTAPASLVSGGMGDFTGCIILTVVFSFVNLTSNAFYLKTIYTTDLNGTEAAVNSRWFNKAPFNWQGDMDVECQPYPLTVGSPFFTSNNGFHYRVKGIRMLNGTADSSAGSPDIRSAIGYKNTALQDCYLKDLLIILYKSDPSELPSWWLTFKNSVVESAVLQCNVLSDAGLAEVTLQADYHGETEKNYDYVIDSNHKTRASVWWGTRLSNAYFIGILAAAARVPKIEEHDGTFLNRARIRFTANPEEADIRSDDFFRLKWSFNFANGRLQQFEMPISKGVKAYNSDFWASPVMTESLHYAKLMNSLFALDLGNCDSPSLLLTHSALQYAIHAPDDMNRKPGGLLNNSATFQRMDALRYNMIPQPGDTDGQNPTVALNESYAAFQPIMGPLSCKNATISAQYLCSVPKQKKIGVMLLAIVLADLVFLQAAWKLLQFVAGTRMSKVPQAMP
ncbi:Non-reducing end alpha-L-arabinofuranosidase BoGH43A [Colletotrichum trifolii]|uniref:Non-reducing end alpha-L-arabinofuranosidase BoGH43A n=1 Tax=Colletotrichum trifolii TaxID=5466 RepID=A0A4R8RVJ8_COLTR|nr:Non-reducing end alpha-L-arabinofuranosidase BoGH43A [Colletotrichum trifolii]